MGVCVWDFVMIIIIVFVYFFDSTCCVTWESIGIFLFSFMKCFSTVMSGIVCACTLSLSREKMSAQKSERDRLMSFLFVYDVCISISERVKSNRIRSKWRRLLWFWMCVCCVWKNWALVCFFNPFRFLTCFCLLLLVVLFSLHIVCFLVYFLFINV